MIQRVEGEQRWGKKEGQEGKQVAKWGRTGVREVEEGRNSRRAEGSKMRWTEKEIGS